MSLPDWQQGLWVASTLLRVGVCYLALKHGLFGRLPLFTSYLVGAALRELSWWAVARYAGYDADFSFYFYWWTQLSVVALRGLAIAEVCRGILEPFRGVWALGWRCLAVVALILLAVAGLSAQANRQFLVDFIPTLDRGLELAAMTVLVGLLLFCRWYGIGVDPPYWQVTMGLAFYSGVQFFNAAMMQALPGELVWWNSIRIISYMVALGMWGQAVLKPLPSAPAPPDLLTQEDYDRLAPAVNARLRELNDRLLRLLKR